jgi:hypothetical protein
MPWQSKPAGLETAAADAEGWLRRQHAIGHPRSLLSELGVALTAQ